METPLLNILLILAIFLSSALTGLTGLSTLSPGNSLDVENENDHLVSPSETFTAGFYKVGTNAYCFSIWFTNSVDKTVIWMANRDTPVNGKQSKLTLYKSGNLVLLDADGSTVWSTNTASSSNAANAEVRLLETGDLVLFNNRVSENVIWESFGFPTDTLLATQRLTYNTTLVSKRTKGTYFSGFYFLKFNDDNVLNLLYTGPMNSSVYWPDPASTVFTNGRTPYIGTKIAVLDEIGNFGSTDSFTFNASDYGIGPKRRLTLDYDGMLRLYSLDESNGSWKLSWRPGELNSCMVRGLCGFNGICIYNPLPTCVCPSGYRRSDPSDWSKGCSRLYNITCDDLSEFDFVELPKTDYYGNDLKTYEIGVTHEACRDKCLFDCECKGYGYAMDGTGECFPKGSLRTGHRIPSDRVTMHLKVPKGMLKSFEGPVAVTTMGLNCSNTPLIIEKNSDEQGKSNRNGYMRLLIAFAASVAAIEMICIGLGWWYVSRYHAKESVEAGYIALALGFKRFTYSELKRATKNFKVQIGMGGFGTVYKGVLDDERVVAVKRLEGVVQGDAQFWAEVSIIGRINHRNLVKLWGFCAENEHKILVYEFLENGSLDKMLFLDSPGDDVLEWDQRFNIAVGTAKGLSYLHEECLEWVLHCDVKPQNILIDSQFEPKVADFGMSMLFKDGNDNGFSKVRGTRGYLAPEWMMNQRIDAKADVYSYGIVLLELLTGKSASGLQSAAASQDKDSNDLAELVTESTRQEKLEKIIDPNLKGNYNKEQLKRMVEVALLCVKDDRSTRPAMSKVIELLIGNDMLKPDEDFEEGINSV